MANFRGLFAAASAIVLHGWYVEIAAEFATNETEENAEAAMAGLGILRY
jgi:hypothetical protein